MGAQHLLDGHVMDTRILFGAGQQTFELVTPLVMADMRDKLGPVEQRLLVAETGQLRFQRGFDIECQLRVIHSWRWIPFSVEPCQVA